MANDELMAKLKQVFDMAVFSQLLERDDDEEREVSSSTLYVFIETGDNIIGDMEKAFPKQDLQRLIPLGESLEESAIALGLKKFENAVKMFGDMEQWRAKPLPPKKY